MRLTSTLSTLFLLCLPAMGMAQELLATVTVNAPQLTIIDRRVLDEFQQVVTDYLNSTRFTDDVYEREERIECNFTFSITNEINERVFNADLLIQVSRPVYGSDYNTTLLNYQDTRARIEYEQFQPIEYSQAVFTSSIASLLTFYANLIIGIDKDSFAPMAGEPFFREAENIVNILPRTVTDSDNSWTNTGGQRSRFRLMQELLNPRARPYRQLIYDYHRKGLDVMAEDPIAGRAVISNSLENLRKVRTDIPNSILISNFSASKTQELIDIYLPASPAERKGAYQIMTAVDPANTSKLRELRS